MIWILYKIIDIDTGKILHIGETVNPTRRLKEHKTKYKQHNIQMILLPAFYYNKKDAYSAQIELQKKCNIITDSDKAAINVYRNREMKSKSFIEKRKKEALTKIKINENTATN